MSNDPQEIANLLREAARGGAQDAIAQYEAKQQLENRSYVSIDSPATALSLLTAICLAVLYLIGAETGPIKDDVKRNQNDIQSTRTEIMKKLDAITEFFMKKK